MEEKKYYKSNLGIFSTYSEHFEDIDANYISYPNFEKAVAEILAREKAIQMDAEVSKPTELEMINELRANEGAEVILYCDNPSFKGCNNAIAICDDWTDWAEKRYEGETLNECLQKALTDKKKAC